MTNANELSLAQRPVLTAGCKRKGGLVLPLTVPLKGGALKKVLHSLITKGFVKEAPASEKQEVWRTGEDRTALTLRATPAAYEALGVGQPKRARGAPAGREKGASKPARRERHDTSRRRSLLPSPASFSQTSTASSRLPCSGLALPPSSKAPSGGRLASRPQVCVSERP